MDHDANLRDRLFLTGLRRELAHQRVVREAGVSRRLRQEVHDVIAESLRLRRRTGWLVRTKKPLPRVID